MQLRMVGVVSCMDLALRLNGLECLIKWLHALHGIVLWVMVVSHLALSLYHLCHDGALDVVAGVLESLTLDRLMQLHMVGVMSCMDLALRLNGLECLIKWLHALHGIVLWV